MPLEPGPRQRLARFLNALPKPTGVWCADDLIGTRVLETAATLGLRVPDDLAVLGFGDFRIAQACKPHLSSIPLPGAIIGHRARPQWFITPELPIPLRAWFSASCGARPGWRCSER